ncbi:MAG: hypothetical protein K6B15_00285 [Parasporobacterium sp.]|nr:hypothetical protein [Parasporobacterium sp.]
MMIFLASACGNNVVDENENTPTLDDTAEIDIIGSTDAGVEESRAERFDKLYNTYVVSVVLDSVEGNVEYFTATVRDSIYDSYSTEDVAVGALKECYSLLSDSNNSPNCEGYTESGKLVFSFGAGGDYEYVHVYDENYRHEQYGLIAEDYDYIMGKQ